MSPRLQKVSALAALFSLGISVGAAIALHSFDGSTARIGLTVSVFLLLIPTFFGRKP